MVNTGVIANVVNPLDPDAQRQRQWTDFQNSIRKTYQPNKTTSSSISDKIANATNAMNSIPTVSGESAEVTAINAANAIKKAKLQAQIDFMNDQLTIIGLNRKYPNATDGMVVNTKDGYYKKKSGQWVRI